MSSKLDRAKYGPSWTEVIFGAFLSIVIGVVAGFLMLALKPVITAKEIPKDAPPGQVYFIPGSKASASGPAVERKEKALEQGQSVTFDEAELNFMFLASGGKDPAPAPAGKPAPAKPGAPATPAAPAAATYSLAASHPSFRLHDGLMQVSATITVGAFGYTQEILCQSDGKFVREDGVFTYQPDVILVGSCPIEKLPFGPGMIKKKVVTALNFPPELQTAWGKLAEVGIEGTSLKLVAAH
jgi:hypothetical protein